jgi:outer membrane receptor protein involved in Fe transport
MTMFLYIRTILVSFVFFGLGALAYGQDAQVQGQVLDTTGAGISKALVRIVDQVTGTERKIETNDNGQYTVPGLKPGSYKIFVEAQGFSTTVSDRLILNAGQNAVFDFTLKIGAASADVVVTAEKSGEERLLDVPIPIGVIDTDTITAQGQLLLRDYFSDVPGLILTPGYDAAQAIIVRGVGATGFDNPAVGITIDDVPFGASTGAGIGWLVPDLDPGDLEHLEVLRGPQGTLYGSNSMGGLIRYVTKDPSTDLISGHIQIGTSAVHNGAEPGYDARGSINLPVTKNIAVRASAFENQSPGYIDNVLSNTKGVNEAENSGARIAGVWRPNDFTSLKVSALYQHNHASGVDEAIVNEGLGDLQENYIPGSGLSNQTIQFYTATLDTKMGPLQVSSTTGYSYLKNYHDLDFTSGFGADAAAAYAGANGSIYYEDDYAHKVSEELKASESIANRIAYSVGGFYTHETAGGWSSANAMNIETGQVYSSRLYYETDDTPITYDEYAGYINSTVQVTKNFDFELGGRITNYKFKNAEVTEDDFFTGSVPSITAPDTSSGTIGTYLFTPRYKLTDNLMVYARFASGFRPGTANPPTAGGMPQSNPDETKTYEVGTKGKLFCGMLTVDGSLYYVDWQNIQISTRTANDVPFETNGSEARSDGLEISASTRLRAGLSLSGWFDYDDAVLTAPFPVAAPAVGKAGDRLPFAARYSGNIAVEQEFHLWKEFVGFVGGQATYLGNRIGEFVDSETRQDYPAYTKLDLHVGAHLGAWEARAYATNASDARGILNGGIGYYNPNAREYITPRSIGVNVERRF